MGEEWKWKRNPLKTPTSSSLRSSPAIPGEANTANALINAHYRQLLLNSCWGWKSAGEERTAKSRRSGGGAMELFTFTLTTPNK